jgi:putative pyruvate formate lyase activating enzyme
LHFITLLIKLHTIMTNYFDIAWYGSHFGEEPPISGTKGSGTIFFCHCNLHCVYCQNWQISQERLGCKKVSEEELVDIILELQKQGFHNINLVTPTIWSLQLIEVLKKAKDRGLRIPIVWNSNAYEKTEILKRLEGLVDIYLPDYKYSDDKLAEKYSKASDYPEIAKEAILEMQGQVGDLRVGEGGVGEKGLIIRHLILPNNLENTRKCLKFIRSISDNIHLSLMTQFNPLFKSRNFPVINRSLNKSEFEKVNQIIDDLNFKNGWIQEFGESDKCFIPDFTKENPFVSDKIYL